MNIDLVRDCLDQQVIDTRGRKLGRIDGILIETSGQGRPRVVGVQVGPATLAGRLPKPLSTWSKYLIQRLRIPGSTQIAWKHLTISRNEVRIDSNDHLAQIQRVEDWVRKHVVARIPGA